VTRWAGIVRQVLYDEEFPWDQKKVKMTIRDTLRNAESKSINLDCPLPSSG
jgi:hypothetical protein